MLVPLVPLVHVYDVIVKNEETTATSTTYVPGRRRTMVLEYVHVYGPLAVAHMVHVYVPSVHMPDRAWFQAH